MLNEEPSAPGGGTGLGDKLAHFDAMLKFWKPQMI